MIRHAGGCWPLPLSVSPLPVAVIEPAFVALLQTSIGVTLLLDAGLPPALLAAVAMAAVAMRADVKDRGTGRPTARSLEQNPIMLCRVHRHRRRVDNGSRFMSG